MKFNVRLALALLAALAVGSAGAAPQTGAIPSKKAHRSLLLDVAYAGKRLVAVGERGHVVLSDDGGLTWRQAPVPVRSMLTAVYFVTPRNGWVVGHDSTVLATTDGGESWSLQHYKEFSAEAADDAAAVDDPAIDDEEMLDDAALDEESGREIGSREGVPLLDVWFSSDGLRGVAVGAYGLLLRTEDGGQHWRDESDRIANRDGWHFNAIGGVPGDPTLVVIAGEKGTLYRSLDAGARFAPLASPYDGSFFGVIGASGGDLYAFGLQGRLYRSSDRGSSWARLDTGVTSGLNDGCQTAEGSVVITGNAGVVISGSDGNATLTTERRADRQAVLSCAGDGDGLVLVGEGGAKRATLTGKPR